MGLPQRIGPMLLRLHVALLLLSAAGCGLVLGLDDFEDAASAAATSGAGGSGGEAGEPPCDACAPPAPTGYQGPVLVYRDEPSCPIGEEVLAGGVNPAPAEPAVCSGCSCGPPVGGCDFNTQLTTAVCGAMDLSLIVMFDGSCAPASANAQSVTVDASVASSQSCLPSDVMVTIPPIVYQETVRGCAPADGGCGQGSLCIPSDASAFELCVWKDGDDACDEVPYTLPIVVETLVGDDRGCTPCGCNPPTLDCNSGGLTLYGDSGCSEPITTIDFTSGVCANVPNGGAQVGSVSATVPGRCAVEQAQPIGSAVHQPRTLCCLEPRP